MDATTSTRSPTRTENWAHPAWPAAELAAAVGLLEWVLWQLRSSGPVWLNVLAYSALVGVMAFSGWRRGRVSADPVPMPMGAGRAWAETLAVAAGLSAALVFAAGFVGDSNETFEFVFLQKPPTKMAAWLVGKFAAALGQQLALQWFLAPTCSELTRGRASGVVLAASIFGLVHLPSPTLVAITFLGGSAWIILYRRSGRLAPLVAAHMILATLAHGALPERLTYDMRVGSTAHEGMKRFEELNDPRIRAINRRLKENRDDLRRLSSDDYYRAQGGNLPDFIRGLYRDVLGRAATDGDVAFWVGKNLRHPQTDLPSFFLASDEYAEIRQARRSSVDGGTVRR